MCHASFCTWTDFHIYIKITWWPKHLLKFSFCRVLCGKCKIKVNTASSPSIKQTNASTAQNQRRFKGSRRWNRAVCRWNDFPDLLISSNCPGWKSSAFIITAESFQLVDKMGFVIGYDYSAWSSAAVTLSLWLQVRSDVFVFCPRKSAIDKQREARGRGERRVSPVTLPTLQRDD